MACASEERWSAQLRQVKMVTAAVEGALRRLEGPGDAVTGELSMGVLREIVQGVAPDAFVEEHFRGLCAEAVLTDATPVPARRFIDQLLGARCTELRRPRQPVLDGEGENGARVRVTNMGGNLVLELNATEAEGLSVQDVKDMIRKTGDLYDCLLQLVASTEELQDGDLRRYLPEDGGAALELTLVLSTPPHLDRALPLRLQLEAVRDRLASDSELLRRRGIQWLTWEVLAGLDGEPALAQDVQNVVDAGLLPLMVPLCQAAATELQQEALWGLAAVAAGTPEQVRAVLAAGAVPAFVVALRSPCAEVRQQGAEALACAAAASVEVRDAAVVHGATGNLAEMLKGVLRAEREEREQSGVLSSGARLLEALCRGQPPLSFDVVQPLLPVITRVLHACGDAAAIASCCGALDSLTGLGGEYLEAVVSEPDLVHGVVQALTEPGLLPGSAALPAVRALGHVAGGSDVQRQRLLDAGALPALQRLGASASPNVGVEISRTVANVSAGLPELHRHLVEEGWIPRLAQSIICLGDVDTEALRALCNIVLWGTKEHALAMVEECGAEALMRVAQFSDEGRVPAVRALAKLVERAVGDRALSSKLQAWDDRLEELVDKLDGPQQLTDETRLPLAALRRYLAASYGNKVLHFDQKAHS